jgi:hypothetical protein
MLDGLDSIPWQQLTHAYGSAEDVPHLLRALRTAPPNQSGLAEAKAAALAPHFGKIEPALNVNGQGRIGLSSAPE